MSFTILGERIDCASELKHISIQMCVFPDSGTTKTKQKKLFSKFLLRFCCFAGQTIF